MKKLLKSKVFWLVAIILLVVIVGVIYKLSSGQNQVTYTTEEVKKGDLTQTVSATGSVESADDISLNFKNPGKLVLLQVKEGDRVIAGQILARLDAASLSAQVKQYQANVAAAQANLAKVKAGSSQEDIKVTSEQVVKAENDLASLQTSSANDIANLRNKALDAINNASFTASVALNKINNYFIKSENITNLQVSNSALLVQVQNSYADLKKQLDDSESLNSSANTQKTEEAIIAANEKLRSVLTNLGSLLSDSFKLADTIIVNSYYTQTAKDATKTDIDAQQTGNSASLTSLQTTKSSLISGLDSYNSQIKAAENNLTIVRAQLALKQAGPRDFEISSAEAQVAQARAQLDQAQAALSDYSIFAPIDGTVTEVNFSVGEQTSLSQPAIKMLGTEKYQIKVDIPESDIAKVKVGNVVVSQLDAFGSDHPFLGAVSFINPAQTVIQDVIYYKTTVSLNEDALNQQIKPGMSADVTITTAEKKDVLYIPQRAVKIQEATLGEVPQKTVDVLLSDNSLESRTVEVGLRGDDGLVEIISGLKAGEKVVTFKKVL